MFSTEHYDAKYDFNKMNKSSICLLFKHYQHISMHKNATSITNSNSERQQ